MPNANLEITQKAMEDFKKIQEYMLLAKEENSIFGSPCPPFPDNVNWLCSDAQVH